MICFGFVEGQIYYSSKNPKYQSSMIFIKLNSQVCFVYKNKYNERQKKKKKNSTQVMLNMLEVPLKVGQDIIKN